MTFKEAIQFKQEWMARNPELRADEFQILIVPDHPEDFDKYCRGFKNKAFSDVSAIPYCLTGQYQVASLKIEGKRVLCKKLS